VDVVNLTKIVL